MGDTKARILQEALELFSREGYEAVSVSQIAGALDMTKGALYRHYKSKRDIFESILSVMEQRDAQGAAAHQLPESPAAQTPEAYRAAALEQLLTYSKAQFRSWTEDSFAAAFRRMLTLEQYRSAEIRALYQQYLAAGPLGYVEDLLAGMGFSQPAERAAALYGPMFLYYSVYDGAEDKAAVAAQLDACLDAAAMELRKQQN